MLIRIQIKLGDLNVSGLKFTNMIQRVNINYNRFEIKQ